MPRIRAATFRVVLALGGFVGLGLALLALYRMSQFSDLDERWLVWGLALLSAAGLWLAMPRAEAMLEILVAPERRVGTVALLTFILFALAIYLSVARFVLEAFPNSGDELAYVIQAQTYELGKLWLTPPPLAEAFNLYRIVEVGHKWVSQYPPGFSMLLASAAELRLPMWLVNPFIGAAILPAYFALARRYVSRDNAWLGVLLLGTSSYFVLNSGSYFSHVLAAFAGVMFALFGTRYIERAGVWRAMAAGACLGLMGLTRTQNAVIFIIPFALEVALTPSRRIGLVWFALGGTPFLLALLAYNGAITGNPLVGVASVLKTEPLGFPNPITFELLLSHLAHLAVWTSPILVVGYGVAFVSAIVRRQTNFTDWIMPITVIALLFYASGGGNQYGPRYYFEAWPFAVLTVLKVVDSYLFSAERSARTAWIASAIATSLLFQIAYLPARFDREHRVVVERQDVYAKVQQNGLRDAIVIIEGDVGTIRPMDARDLVRNDFPVADQRVIYALSRRATNAGLPLQFPGRDLYIYSNGRLERVKRSNTKNGVVGEFFEIPRGRT